MPNLIQLIVGLANPGAEYTKTRHNAGEWLIEKLIQEQNISLKPEKKFHGLFGKIKINEEDCYLLIPTTYMNRSGLAIRAVANFYKIPPEAILVVHDELDLLPGTVRIKQGGGDGGHNGLRDTTAQLGKDYWRLRIGIGHPGARDKVLDYVLGNPSRDDREKINTAIDNALTVLPQFVQGDTGRAIQTLHTAE